MISIENLSFEYGEKAVLGNISAGLHEGCIYGLLGANGSGKTTLLKLISGMIFPGQGRITADGIDTSAREAETLGKIFYMQSEFRFGKQSLEKFIALHRAFYPGFSDEILEDCLEKSGINPKTGDLGVLSTGEKRKLLFSIALASGTKYLLMDEPMNGMDIPSRSLFRKLLLEHLGEDRTAVISTHTPAEMENILSDILILDGKGGLFAKSTEEISDSWCLGLSEADEGALYSDPCAGGYRTIKKRGEDEATGIDLEMLFNATIKGKLL